MGGRRSGPVRWLSRRGIGGATLLVVTGAAVVAGLVGLGLDLLLLAGDHPNLAYLLLATGVTVPLIATPLGLFLAGILGELERSRRRLAEESAVARRATERFRDFAECSSDWFWETDEEHRFIWFSERHDEAVGVPAARRLGIRRTELQSDDPANDDFARHLDDLEHRRPFRNFRYAFVDPHGHRHVVLVSGKPVFDAAGAFGGYRGIGHEITQEYEQERALRDRERRLSKAQRVARLGDWRWEVGTRELVWSAETWRIFGVDPGRVELSLDNYLAMVHPDDRASVAERLEAAGRRREAYEYEVRIIRADGELRHLWADAVPETDERGEVVAFFGVCQDVTERKQAEIALRLSEERFRDFAEASSDWLWELDEGLRFSYISGRLESITGIDPAWLIGKRRDELIKDPSQDGWAEHLADLEAHRPFRDFVYGYVSPEGCQHHFKVSGVPVFDPEGGFRGYRGTGTEITEQVQAEERVRHLAHHDPLTGLPNRALFQDRLDQALVRAGRGGHKVALLQLDLDRFKDVNDTLGHPAGDALLCETAARLQRCVRGVDTVARLGGDEFALVLGEIDGPIGAGRVAQKVIEALDAPVEFQDQTIHSGTSIGVTIYPTDGDQPERLLKNADLALYRAKQGGRGAFSFFVPEMKEQVERRKQIETELRAALACDQFVLLWQPIVRLADGTLHGFEVLLRWRHPERGEISPGEFIAIADEAGLTVPIGELVLRRACAQTRAWHEAGFHGVNLGVNVALAQFRRGGLVETVDAVLRETGLAPRHLELDVTESVLSERLHDAAFEPLWALHRRGVTFALDDFGTGYASLGRLKHFPVDRLKIDQSFVRDIGTDPDDAAIARAVINLGHSLDLEVVAEGVESAEQLAFLRLNGCDLAQGYHFGPPMPAAAAEAFLAEAMPRRARADAASSPV